ncbi:MAG: hypothetical protein LBE12_03085 [Planctomycetaceae bacterium]|jgi:hypothetical protein|nr:hypothetical protein [Planctomycetaceae bacterium]
MDNTRTNPSAGDYLGMKATAALGNKSTQSKPIDVGIYTLTGLAWNQVTNGAAITSGKIYPEKPNSSAAAQKDVNAVASIDRLPSAGMKGTVHLKLLDPMNQCNASIGTPTNVGTAPNDNNGSLSNIDGKTLKFTQGSGINAWVKGTFATAHPGDNYLFAAHPHSGIASGITIDTTNPTTVADVVTGKKPTASSILEVWRTLWAELDQMTLPPNNKLHAGEPPISGIVQNGFNVACISVKKFTPNPKPETPGDEIRPAWSSTVASKYSAIRDSPSPTNDFWTIQIIGSFRHVDGAYGTYAANMIFIYGWEIENDYPGSVAAREETVLHEIGHGFTLLDSSPPDNTVMSSPAPLLLYQHFSPQQIRIIQAQSMPQ